jgi:hypothetical protein
MAQYDALSPALIKKIQADLADGSYPNMAFPDEGIIRRQASSHATIWRPPFV